MYERIGSLLPEALNRLRVSSPVKASKVCAAVTDVLTAQWDHAVPMRAIIYKDGTVTVAVTSSAWGHEVTANTETVKTAANKALKSQVVERIRTRVSPKAARGEEY